MSSATMILCLLVMIEARATLGTLYLLPKPWLVDAPLPLLPARQQRVLPRGLVSREAWRAGNRTLGKPLEADILVRLAVIEQRVQEVLG
jgi:hypothetical protein